MQITKLKSKHKSWKRDINFSNFLKIYKKLKDNLEKVRWPTSYYKTVLYYIDSQKNMLDQIKKYTKIKQKEEEQKENLETKKTENENFLSKLKNSISELNKNIKSKQLSLTDLKKSREREREAS